MTTFPAEPFGPFARLEVEAVPLAVVRHEGIRISDLSDAFDAGYTVLGGLFAAGTLTPAGPAIAVYYGNPMEVFDLELGFPVDEAPAQPIDADGVTVIASSLPAGPATATSVLGSYDGLGEGWGGLVERTLAAGEQIRGMSIEVYVSDPHVPEDERRTDLILPLTAH